MIFVIVVYVAIKASDTIELEEQTEEMPTADESSKSALNFIPKSSDDEYQTWNNGNNDHSMDKYNRSIVMNQTNMTSGLLTTGV